ncbi:YeeE/YedE family protein [Bradyrhizobium oligotrophicum]|uniref:YeeE/YedE family protein n=2 Tax=Nitrobacteraceae TaxID=41294 RepID=UPI003EB75A3F
MRRFEFAMAASRPAASSALTSSAATMASRVLRLACVVIIVTSSFSYICNNAHDSRLQHAPDEGIKDDMITEYTAVTALAGGALIGAAAVMLMGLTGRIAGVSGIAARLLPPWDSALAGRLAFIGGLVAAALAVRIVSGSLPPLKLEVGPIDMVAAGLLVGFGAVWGNGCTSGHGVCGIASLSPRSIVATLVFMATAVATTFLVRHVL